MPGNFGWDEPIIEPAGIAVIFAAGVVVVAAFGGAIYGLYRLARML